MQLDNETEAIAFIYATKNIKLFWFPAFLFYNTIKVQLTNAVTKCIHIGLEHLLPQDTTYLCHWVYICMLFIHSKV